MANQSIKQEIYNSMIQKAFAEKRNEELAALNNDFAAFQEQQKNPEALMADFNSFMESQKPKAQPVQTAPTGFVRPTTGVPDANGVVTKQAVDYVNMPGNQFDKEKAAETIAKKELERDIKKNNKLGDIAGEISENIIPKLGESRKSKDKGTEKWDKSVKDVVNALNSKETKQANALADYNKNVAEKAKVDQWLSPDYKLTDEEKKAAKEYATAELQKFAYDSNKKPVNLTSPEDKQRYADMVNLLNKSNAFTNSMAGFTRPLTNLALGVRDIGSDVANQLTGLGAAIGDKFGLTEGATQRHNEKVAENEAARQYTRDLMNTTYHNAQTQNPRATTIGEIGGQVSMYALTNPMFDSLGAAAGLGKAGSFALNQVGQNAQDLALDTIPRLEEYKEGGITDEERKELLKNVGINAAGNLAMGAVGEGISALAKNRAARKAADAAFRANALEGADKLAKLAGTEDIDNIVRSATRQTEEAAQNIEDISKQIPKVPEEPKNYIPSMEELRELEREASVMDEAEDLSNIWKSDVDTKGLRPYAKNQGVSPSIENAAEELSKQMDAPKYSVDAGVDNPNLTKEANDAINSYLFQLEDPFNNPKVDDAVGGLISKVTSDNGFKLMDDYNELSRQLRESVEDNPAIREQLAELRKGINSVDKGERDAVKDLLDYADIQNAIADYKKALNGMDEEAIDKAAKSLDAARNRVARRNNADATLKEAFGGSYGPIINRPKNAFEIKPDEAVVDDMVADWVKQDLENPNRFVEDVSKRNKVMAEDTGITPPKKPQSVKETFEIPDTPENAPTGPKPGTTEDLWNQLENAGKEQTTAPSPEIVAPRTQEINEQGKKLSRLHGTLQNTDKLTDAEKQVFADKNGFWYDPDKEKELADGVKAEIEANGLDSIYNKYADADLDYSKLSGIDSHRLHTAAFDYSRLGTEALQNGDKDLASFYNAKARALELKAREIGTAGGQFNAATAYYARTPEGAVNKAYEILDDQIKDFKAKNPKLTDSIDELSNLISKRLKDVDVDSIMTGTDEAAKSDLRKQIMDGLSEYLDKSNNKQLKNALDGLSDSEIDQLIADKYAKDIAKTLDMFSMGSFGVKQETIDQVLDIFEEAQQYGINSKQYYKLEKQAYALLANDLMDGKSFKDKFNAWRYFAMLSNPLTHIRNNLGNLTNGGLVGIKNNLAAAIEAGAERAAKAQGKSGIQGGRTKSVLNLATDKDLIEAAAKDFDDEAYRIYKQGGSKWINVGDDIEAAAHTWKDKGAGKVLNTLTEGNSKALDVEDIIAGKAKYQTSMAGFLKANGADASIFTKTDDASKQLLDQARTYALNQANEATFHQNSKLAKYFTKHFNGKIGNVVIPFKKTPANILQASFEYSPAMFLHVARETNAWKKGVITTAQYIDDISKGLVGSVGLGIGALLAHEGILSVSSGNEKEDAFNKKRGQQTLALKIGGKYFNIGDLAPASMPLVVGASIYDTAKNAKSGGDAALDSILNGLGTISNTVTDMTMLSGLADFVSAARYAESNADVGLSLAENVVGNLASQMLPTVGGKIEKTIDDTKRTTYTDKTGKLAKYVDQERRYLQTKIPALQEIGEKMEKSNNQTIAKLGDAFTLEPQIDGWGNEMKVEDYGIGTGGRAITNFVNPITTTTDTSDRLDEELRQIYKDNKNDENVLKFGQNSSSEAKVGDEKMTDKQWTEYQKANGQMKHDLGMSFIDSEAYKNMSAADKASALSTMGDFAKAYNQNKIAGKEMSSANQKLAEIYESAGGGKKGAEAVANEAAAKSFAKDTGFSSSSNAAKAIQEDVKNGDLDAANEKKEAAKTIQDYGLTKPGPSYTYYNAQEKIPSLTPEEFSKTYKAIDSNGNQGITQDELINYLNKSKISEAEGKKIWSAYGSSNWKAIPKLQDGTWKKGK